MQSGIMPETVPQTFPWDSSLLEDASLGQACDIVSILGLMTVSFTSSYNMTGLIHDHAQVLFCLFIFKTILEC